MKTLLFSLFVAFISVQLSAQDISLTQPITGGRNHFYIGMVGKTATLNGDWGLFAGARAGYNINENVSIGAVAHGLIPVKLSDSYINRDGRDELHLGYGGLEAAYNYPLTDKLYLTGMMMIGAARTDYEKLGGNDYFFIMEPGASVSYRITNYFGLNVAANYRLASGVKYADFSNASFSGWSTDLGFTFGF